MALTSSMSSAVSMSLFNRSLNDMFVSEVRRGWHWLDGVWAVEALGWDADGRVC